MKGIKNTMAGKDKVHPGPIDSHYWNNPKLLSQSPPLFLLTGTWQQHRTSWSDTALHRLASPNAIYLTSFTKMVERGVKERKVTKGKVSDGKEHCFKEADKDTRDLANNIFVLCPTVLVHNGLVRHQRLGLGETHFQMWMRIVLCCRYFCVCCIQK
jgi:hypothetical protein